MITDPHHCQKVQFLCHLVQFCWKPNAIQHRIYSHTRGCRVQTYLTMLSTSVTSTFLKFVRTGFSKPISFLGKKGKIKGLATQDCIFLAGYDFSGSSLLLQLRPVFIQIQVPTLFLIKNRLEQEQYLSTLRYLTLYSLQPSKQKIPESNK